MSFISYTFSHFDIDTEKHIYILIDSDFGDEEIELESWIEVRHGVAVAIEYVRREYTPKQLGRNLALFNLYYSKDTEYSIADLNRWQDTYCPSYIENWEMYAKERDIQLEKLAILL